MEKKAKVYKVGTKEFIRRVKTGNIALDVSSIDINIYCDMGEFCMRVVAIANIIHPSYTIDNQRHMFRSGIYPTNRELVYVLDADMWVSKGGDYYNAFICRDYTLRDGILMHCVRKLYAGYKTGLVLDKNIAKAILSNADIMSVVCKHMDLKTLCCFSKASKRTHSITSKAVSITDRVDMLLRGYTLYERVHCLLCMKMPYTIVEILMHKAPIVVLYYYRHNTKDIHTLLEIDPCLAFLILMEPIRLPITVGAIDMYHWQAGICTTLRFLDPSVEVWKNRPYAGKDMLAKLPNTPQKNIRKVFASMLCTYNHPLYAVVASGEGCKLSVK